MGKRERRRRIERGIGVGGCLAKEERERKGSAAVLVLKNMFKAVF